MGLLVYWLSVVGYQLSVVGNSAQYAQLTSAAIRRKKMLSSVIKELYHSKYLT
jgi:hypothetical protein